MIQGNFDLKKYNNFHTSLEYFNPSDGTVGFNFSDIQDKNRYLPNSIKAHIARDLPEDVGNFFKATFSLDDIAFSVQKMLPGMILPYHSDKYGFYLSKHQNLTINEIQRIIVFLEDWKPGHISEVDGESHTQWNQGDWITWCGSTPHLAANLGSSDRYTLQITGIIK